MNSPGVCRYVVDHIKALMHPLAKFGGGRAIVIKGDSRAHAPISQLSPVDVGPQGKNVKFGVRVGR